MRLTTYIVASEKENSIKHLWLPFWDKGVGPTLHIHFIKSAPWSDD